MTPPTVTSTSATADSTEPQTETHRLNGKHAAPAEVADTRLRLPPAPVRAPGQSAIALFCFEAPDSPVGRHVVQVAAALAGRQTAVHIFARDAFDAQAGVTSHRLGDIDGSLLDRVHEFGRRAAQAYLTRFPEGAGRVGLLAFDWSALPAVRQVQASRGADVILSLHSLERQRSDMSGDLSRAIHEIELAGLRDSQSLLFHDPATAEVARSCLPASAARAVMARQPFPAENFDCVLDPGAVKARYQVGPLDPTILFVGNFDQRHAPDVLMKSVPAILKNHPQARFVFVGDGELFWPLKVHARYLLLEHAVRQLGHLGGQPLFDLIRAADVVVVPSREATEWWQVQAAWAAERPVVVSHSLVGPMGLRHDHDCVAIYPHESSCVWGVERVLFDHDLRPTIAKGGKQRLQERFGWSVAAEQIEELLAVPSFRG